MVAPMLYPNLQGSDVLVWHDCDHFRACHAAVAACPSLLYPRARIKLSDGNIDCSVTAAALGVYHPICTDWQFDVWEDGRNFWKRAFCLIHAGGQNRQHLIEIGTLRRHT